MDRSSYRIDRGSRKRNYATILFVLILICVIAFTAIKLGMGEKEQTEAQTTNETKTSRSNSNTNDFNKKQYPTDEPSSIWVVVNKKRPLAPANYAPNDLKVPLTPLRLSAENGEMHLRTVAANALDAMTEAARKQGINLMLASGYRSYDLQVSVYGAEVKNYGQAKADSESARPGYSEHQTGLAADLEPTSKECEIEACFADTAEGKWLAANAYKYGFIIRYPSGLTDITGYTYEPWHVRYVGVLLAIEMRNDNIQTLEQFFSLTNAGSY